MSLKRSAGMKVTRVAAVVRQTWTQKDQARLLYLREQELSFSAIGKIMGRATENCENKWYALTGADSPDKHWPPQSDPWAAKVNFASENVPVPSKKAVVFGRPSGVVGSLVGSAAALCAE